jgi:hypothetical protein
MECFMPEQIALIEVALIDVSDRNTTALAHAIGEGEVLGRRAKFRLTEGATPRVEVHVDKNVFAISLSEMILGAVSAIEADITAKVKARALAVHGDRPKSQTTLAVEALYRGTSKPADGAQSDAQACQFIVAGPDGAPLEMGIDWGREE